MLKNLFYVVEWIAAAIIWVLFMLLMMEWENPGISRWLIK